MLIKNKITKAIHLTALLAATFSAGYSVQSIASEQAIEDVERIEITGSRIKRHDLENSSPVTLVNAAQIEMAGVDNISDLINQCSGQARPHTFSLHFQTQLATCHLMTYEAELSCSI